MKKIKNNNLKRIIHIFFNRNNIMSYFGVSISIILLTFICIFGFNKIEVNAADSIEIKQDGTEISVTGTFDANEKIFTIYSEGGILASNWKTKINSISGNIETIKFSGNVKASSCSNLFSWFAKLKKIEFGSSFDTTGIDNMTNMFNTSKNLKSVDINNINTSSLKNASKMFINCESLESLNFFTNDLSKIEDMSSMFEGCISIGSIIFPENIKDAKLKKVERLFYKCNNLSELDVSNFDTSLVTNMEYMFWYCKKLEELDVSKFETGNVKDMKYMFAGVKEVTELNLLNFDTSNVKDMTAMFSFMSSITKLDLSNFNTSSVNDMNGMFMECTSLIELDLTSFDTSSVVGEYITNADGSMNITGMAYMFDSCSSLTTVDLTNFDTSNVIAMHSMFNKCSKLSNIAISDSFVTSNVENMRYMFNECDSLNNDVLSNITSKFDTSNVKSMERMFAECDKITSIDVSSFDVGKVENISGIFENCKELKNIKLPNNFNSALLEETSNIAFKCGNLEKIDFSNIDIKTQNSFFDIIDSYINAINELYSNPAANVQSSIEYINSLLPNDWLKMDEIKSNYINVDDFIDKTLRSVIYVDTGIDINDPAQYPTYFLGECDELVEIKFGNVSTDLPIEGAFKVNSTEPKFTKIYVPNASSPILSYNYWEEDNRTLMKMSMNKEDATITVGSPDIELEINAESGVYVNEVNAALTYEWYYSSDDGETYIKLIGETNNTLNIESQLDKAGKYYCKVKDTALNKEYDSQVFTLTVKGKATIKFAADLSNIIEIKELGYNEEYGELPKPIKTGYKFKGWFNDVDASGNGIGDEITEDNLVDVLDEVTFYAKWEKITETSSGESSNNASKDTKTIIASSTKGGSSSYASYMNGYKDGTFKPNANITRGEVAAIIANIDSRYNKYEIYTKQLEKYNDIKSTLWSAPSIGFVSKLGIMGGYKDSTFRPSDMITRSEMAVVLVNYKGYALPKETSLAKTKFTDIKGRWFEKYVVALEEKGLVNGKKDTKGNMTYMPDKYMTRAEACTMINAILGRKPNKEKVLKQDSSINKFKDVDMNSWYYADVMSATNSHTKGLYE